MAGRNAKSLVTCTDQTCCQNPDDLFNHSKRHALIQSMRLIERLNTIPVSRRTGHLLGVTIPEVGSNLRKAKKIKISDESLTVRLGKKSDRVDLMHQTLECLHDELENMPVALTPISKLNPVNKGRLIA